jgi:hypothetical protein
MAVAEKLQTIVWLDLDSKSFDRWIKQAQSFIDDFQKRLNSVRWKELSDNLANLRLKAKDLREELKLATTSWQKLIIQSNLEWVNKQITTMNAQLKNFLERGNSSVSGIWQRITDIASDLASAGIISWISMLSSTILSVASSFETYRSILKNSLWSTELARQSFEMLQNVASKTPFSLDEITQSYIKLINRWFKPTQAEIILLWDLASSQWKKFDQLVEAMLDAQTWEFERLKEFWVKARTSWDQVSFTFKWVTTTVSKTDEAIKWYILWLWNLQWIQWAMASQSNTYAGAVSNLKDAMWQLSSTIWSAFLPILTTLVKFTSSVVSGIVERSKENKTLSTIFSMLIWTIVLAWTALWAYNILLPIAASLTAALWIWSITLWVAIWSILLPITAVIWWMLLLNEAYKTNFWGFKDYVDWYVDNINIMIEMVSILVNSTKPLLDELWRIFWETFWWIKTSFESLRTSSWVVSAIFDTIIWIARDRIFIFWWLVNNLLNLVQKIPWVSWLITQAKWNIAQRKVADLWITSPAKFNPLELEKKANKDTTWPVKTTWWSKTKKEAEFTAWSIAKLRDELSKAEKEVDNSVIWSAKYVEAKKKVRTITEQLDNALWKETEALKDTKEEAKGIWDILKNEMNKSKEAVNELDKQINDLVTSIKKIDDDIWWLGKDLLDRYVTVKEELSKWDISFTDRTKLEEELALIEWSTDATARAESLRVASLSETQRILEEMKRLEWEKTTNQEKLAELETQKLLEQAIYDAHNKQLIELEKLYTSSLEWESNKRIIQINNEIKATQRLLDLKKALWWWTAQAVVNWINTPLSSWSSVSNTNNSNSSANITIQTNSGDPQTIANYVENSLKKHLRTIPRITHT